MTTFGATDSYIPDEDELDVTYPTDEFEEIEITEFRMGLEDRVDLHVIGMQDNPVQAVDEIGNEARGIGLFLGFSLG